MEQQARVYDPTSGRGVTIDEANAIINGGRNATPEGPMQGNIKLPMLSPSPFSDGSKDVALDLPPGGDPELGNQIMAAAPQVAGMLATMYPPLRGFKAAALIPAVTRGLIDVVVNGGDLDINKMAEEAVLGAAGHSIGATGSALAKGGTSVVRRSLDLAGSGLLNEAAEQTLPAAAIRENATMSPAGAQKMFDKFAQTGAHVYDELGTALKNAGLKSRNSPNVNGGGITSIIGHKLLPPETQLEIGKFMAKPFNLVGADTAGQGVEQAVRALFSYLQSQTAPPAPSGPQRRPLP